MNKDNLVKRLSNLGFDLFEPGTNEDSNLTLTDLVKSNNLRLWEGFSVVLANVAEKGLFDYKKAKEYLASNSEKSAFDSLLLMSFALYKVLNLKFHWANELFKNLSSVKLGEFNDMLEKLKKNQDFKVAGLVMSPPRLKTVFNNYFNQAQAKLSDLLSLKEEFGLEYALSKLFSPKQKELFLKRVKGEKLTKTEREYFSRVVRKKVLALANFQLQRLAEKLLE